MMCGCDGGWYGGDMSLKSVFAQIRAKHLNCWLVLNKPQPNYSRGAPYLTYEGDCGACVTCCALCLLRQKTAIRNVPAVAVQMDVNHQK